MSLQRLIINTNLTANGFKSECNLAPLQLPALQNFYNYIGALSGGLQSASLSFKVGAVQAAGTFTFSSTGPTNGQTCTICGLTFTAVTAASGVREFTRSNTPSVNATNLAAAINLASNGLTGICTAVAANAVVTVTAVVPGLIGNGLVMANVNLSNTVVVSFTNGSDGTAYDLTF